MDLAHRLFTLARLRLLAVALLSAMVLAGASARADAPIEGVWSFNGGKVAVTPDPGGGFVGTVVSPTRFAECTHPVDERMWTKIVRQPDGSYWGLHQWFFSAPSCARNSVLGATAWRVLNSGKSRYLRVCFTEPGSGEQPTIDAQGNVLSASFGCVNSALVSEVPEISSADLRHYLLWPDNRSCLRRRSLRVVIRDPQNDPVDKAKVVLRSKGIHRRAKLRRGSGRTVAVLRLTGLRSRRFRVVVRITTVLGQHLTGSRRYRLCGRVGRR